MFIKEMEENPVCVFKCLEILCGPICWIFTLRGREIIPTNIGMGYQFTGMIACVIITLCLRIGCYPPPPTHTHTHSYTHILWNIKHHDSLEKRYLVSELALTVPVFAICTGIPKDACLSITCQSCTCMTRFALGIVIVVYKGNWEESFCGPWIWSASSPPWVSISPYPLKILHSHRFTPRPLRVTHYLGPYMFIYFIHILKILQDRHHFLFASATPAHNQVKNTSMLTKWMNP